MLEKYLNDYYRYKITKAEIEKLEGINYYAFYKWFKNKDLLTYENIMGKLNFTNSKLRSVLVAKYTNICQRCNGKQDKYGHYSGMEYLPVFTWVQFCNDNKTKLERMWERYASEGRNLKFAISVDRIDNSKGYTIDNIEFVTHGFNSWKRNITRPVKVVDTDSGESKYFASCQEGSVHYGIRRQDLGEVLHGKRYCNPRFKVEICAIDDVLKHSGCRNIHEYYEKYYTKGSDLA